MTAACFAQSLLRQFCLFVKTPYVLLLQVSNDGMSCSSGHCTLQHPAMPLSMWVCHMRVTMLGDWRASWSELAANLVAEMPTGRLI